MTTRNRLGLTRALARVEGGDVFILAEWDRVIRSMSDGLDLITRIIRLRC